MVQLWEGTGSATCASDSVPPPEEERACAIQTLDHEGRGRGGSGRAGEPLAALKRVEMVKAADFPTYSPLPRFVEIGSRMLDTRLRCAERGRVHVVLDSRGWPTPRGAALGLTQKPSDGAAIVVLQSGDRAVLLHLGHEGSLLSRTTLRRLDSTWFPEMSTRCSK